MGSWEVEREGIGTDGLILFRGEGKKRNGFEIGSGRMGVEGLDVRWIHIENGSQENKKRESLAGVGPGDSMEGCSPFSGVSWRIRFLFHGTPVPLV